jgi:hypothetical protein
MKKSGIGIALACVLAPSIASAFCGFYVGGADQKLFNNATQVVLMREGTRTVLAMQNDYQGPPDGFAMVVPVPVVLQKENVKTLPKDVFDRVDKLTAPRLVEYWEQDPCPRPMNGPGGGGMPLPSPAPAMVRIEGNQITLGVTVEAKFSVGEYDIVILSAKDAAGLDTWLRQEKYKIPQGAEPYLRPYVQAGSKFFVAKVDVTKVKMENGHAALSPLRFHYDSADFTLPVRLGLINSNGTQDLIVNVLAQGQRFEPVNYPSVTIPTNLDVAEDARGSFGSFYAALFDETIAKKKNAIVTEYSWDASTCDPCPGPALQPEDFATLGADVVPNAGPPTARVEPAVKGAALTGDAWNVVMAVQTCWQQTVAQKQGVKGGAIEVKVAPKPAAPGVVATVTKNDSGEAQLATCVKTQVEQRYTRTPLGFEMTVPLKLSSAPQPRLYGWTITRLHARYTKDSLGQDIVFRRAGAIMGGREVRDAFGQLEHGATQSGTNNFQGRYAIRHPWTGPIACANPQRGIWGGPPPGVGVASSGPTPAQNLAFVARGGVSLPKVLRSDVPELGLIGLAVPPPTAGAPTPPPSASAPPPPPDAGTEAPPVEAKGCRGCTIGAPSRSAALAIAAAVGALVLARLRRLSRSGSSAPRHPRESPPDAPRSALRTRR